jgi:pimeloyl-ACP methyl ester carboxylesterase
VSARERDAVFALIHSPLVGPTTWSPVARELERRGREAVVPSLLGVADAAAPQWRHVPKAIVATTARILNPIVLVGHSGGGLLLPTIADGLTVEVAALVFVDSFLPPAGGSLPLAPPGFIDELRALATDGVLPRWSSWFGENALRELVPDERLRAALEAEMPRLPLSYFEASVPVSHGWEAHP